MKIDVEGAEPSILGDILDHLDEYPADMKLLVEANPHDDPVRFRALFDRLRQAEFTAWRIDNEYTNEWYLRWRPTPSTLLDAAPQEQCDLLLTRQPTGD